MISLWKVNQKLFKSKKMNKWRLRCAVLVLLRQLLGRSSSASSARHSYVLNAARMELITTLTILCVWENQRKIHMYKNFWLIIHLYLKWYLSLIKVLKSAGVEKDLLGTGQSRTPDKPIGHPEQLRFRWLSQIAFSSHKRYTDESKSNSLWRSQFVWQLLKLWEFTTFSLN